MIVYGMNRLPLAQESNQELPPGAEPQAASAVPAPVLAEGSGGELVGDSSMLGVMKPYDEDDTRPPIIKK